MTAIIQAPLYYYCRVSFAGTYQAHIGHTPKSGRGCKPRATRLMHGVLNLRIVIHSAISTSGLLTEERRIQRKEHRQGAHTARRRWDDMLRRCLRTGGSQWECVCQVPQKVKPHEPGRHQTSMHFCKGESWQFVWWVLGLGN